MIKNLSQLESYTSRIVYDEPTDIYMNAQLSKVIANRKIYIQTN